MSGHSPKAPCYYTGQPANQSESGWFHLPRHIHLLAVVRFRVRIDGALPGAAHGLDLDEQGNVTASEPRMYQLIRQPNPISDRTFDIEFLDSAVEVFDFTFG